jgi:hypothetical protein
MDSLTLERPSTKTGHVRLGTRFIQEDQLGRVKTRLALTPEAARPRDVGAVLFTGAECLFLYVNPSFPNTTLMACKEHWSPVASRNSRKVRSFFLASNDRSRLR